jgi:hypothetical protein
MVDMGKMCTGMFRRSVLLSSVSVLLFSPFFSPGGDLYKWVDEEGIIHMVDTQSQIPQKYRNQADKRTTDTQQATSEKMGATTAGITINRFTVPYQAFEGTSRRIIVPVTFNDSVSARLLLDTGSPGLMISPKLADRIGLLDEEDGNLMVMAGGVGGSTPAILSVVENLKVGEGRVEFVPATIAQVPSEQFEGLVGMDFMANYRIGIDTQRNVLVFEELPPHPDRPGGHDESWWRTNFRNFESLRAVWDRYLDTLKAVDLTSSERERRARIAKTQFTAADELCHKLERYARDNAVPLQWRH